MAVHPGQIGWMMRETLAEKGLIPDHHAEGIFNAFL